MIGRVLCALLGFSATLCTGQASPSAALLQGKYVVDGLDCVKCGNRRVVEKGRIVDFEPAGINNELGDDCHGTPGYDLLEAMSGSAAIKAYGGSWPRSLQGKLRFAKQVRYGFVTCKSMNYAQVLFASDNDLYYFTEGGVVFHLKKTSKSGS